MSQPSHSLTHLEQLPVLQAPFMLSALYRYTISSLLYHISTVLFLCWETQILTIVTTAYRIQHSNMMYRLAASLCTIQTTCIRRLSGPSRFVWVHSVMLTQWWNCLTTHLSECSPFVKWHMALCVCVCVCHSFFIHSSVDGHLGWGPVLATVNNKHRGTLTLVFPFPADRFPEVECLDLWFFFEELPYYIL